MLMRVVIFLGSLVASAISCQRPRCDLLGKQLCQRSTQDSGLIDITCSGAERRILQDKDWVDGKTPSPNSCGEIESFKSNTPAICATPVQKQYSVPDISYVTCLAKGQCKATAISEETYEYCCDAKPKPSDSICRVGDSVKAIYRKNAKMYEAKIASIDGNTITVDWDDGDPTYTQVDRKYVYKITVRNNLENGVLCLWTADSPTSAAPTACKSWCAGNKKDWKEKCTWTKNCGGCDECTIPSRPTTRAAPTKLCKSWCADSKKDWKEKCTWTKTCGGCDDCHVKSLCKSWCSDNKKDWKDKCTWTKTCGACSECLGMRHLPDYRMDSTNETYVYADSAQACSLAQHVVTTMMLISWLSYV